MSDSVACQAPLSMGFPRQEYWSGLLFPTPGDGLPRPPHNLFGLAWLPSSPAHPPHTSGLLVSRYRPSSSPDPREQGNQAVTPCILEFLSKALGFSTDPAQKGSDSFPSSLGPTCTTVQIDNVLSILGVRPFAGHKGCRDGSAQATAGTETNRGNRCLIQANDASTAVSNTTEVYGGRP